jgi:hypothetical protein
MRTAFNSCGWRTLTANGSVTAGEIKCSVVRGRVNAMDDVIFQTRTKATTREGDRIRSSFNWVIARRSRLVLGPDAMTCGDWHLPYAEFESAILVTIPSVFGKAHTLMVKCRGQTYQFQLPTESVWRLVIHPFWNGPLPFPIVRELRQMEQPSGWLALVGLVAIAVGLLLPLFR